MSTESDTVLLQIKKRGGWRDFVGMSALNIVFHQSEHVLTVEIWRRKVDGQSSRRQVSMFILWPLAVTAAKGAWDQWWMPDRIFDQIATQLASA